MSIAAKPNFTDTLKQIQSTIHDKAVRLGDFMYGTQERTWMTLGVTFVMLVGGISMMKFAAGGGACAIMGG